MQPSPRFRAFLERPTLGRWLVAIAVVLCLPSIVTGLQIDDLFHKGLLQGAHPFGPFAKGPLRLFTFLDGDPARTRLMTAEGIFPWWTGESIRLAFCRPLSAATHWLDYVLWPGAPWLMHVHSYAWFALVVAASTALYRRILGATWIAGLAALMFAVHDAHAIPATWIANRNATIALLFGLLTLWAHRRRSLWAPVSLAVALCAGESALSTVALLVSHALFLEDEPIRRRLGRLFLYLPVLVVWVVAYRHFGFGTHGSGLYFDPGREPLRFALAAMERLPLLFLGTLVALPVDAAFFAPRGVQLALVVSAWFVTLLVAVWVHPVVRARPTARFFALITVLSLVPSCATIPSGRLLMFASFGAMGLFAEAMAHGAERPARAMLVLRVAIAPLLLVVGNFQMPVAGTLIERFARSLPTDPALPSQDLILITSFDVAASGYVSMKRELMGGPRPLHTHVMAVGDRDVMVTRLDERSLLVRPRGGFLADNFSRLFRGEPFAVGARVEWVNATIEVTEVNEGRPMAARFTFREPLEDRGYRFMKFAGKALVPFALPAVGETVTIPPGQLF